MSTFSKQLCVVRLDRVQFTASRGTESVPQIPGFVVDKDTFVRPQTTIRTYRRVRVLRNPTSQVTLFIQYGLSAPWLAPFKITVIADDRSGLLRSDLTDITGRFNNVRLLTIELALDFEKQSGVNQAFVLRHGLFGKSRFVAGRSCDDMRCGTRHSSSMVRSYDKTSLALYRVEVELHSPWLRAHGINQADSLDALPTLLFPGRVQFVTVDWDRLASHLIRRGLSAPQIISEARARARSLPCVLAYLRKDMKITNVHRFLRPLRINLTVRQALRVWAEQWEREQGGAE